MEISVYCGDVWRRYVCAVLSVVSDRHGRAGDDDGICGGPRQQEECDPELYGIGEAGAEVASERLSWYGGELSVDDVLYDGGRMDAVLFLPDVDRKIYGQRQGTGRRHVSGDAGESVGADGGDGDHRGGGDSDLLPWPAERCGEDHQGDDDAASFHHCSIGGAEHDAGGRRRRVEVLFASGCAEDAGSRGS